MVSHFAASEPIGLDAELSDMKEDVILASEAGGPVDGNLVAEQYMKSKRNNKLYMEHAGTHVLEAVLPAIKDVYYDLLVLITVHN